MGPPLLTVLASLVWLDGLGWLIGVLPALVYAGTRRELPRLGGLRLLSGPFERLGINGLIVAGLLFCGVSAFKLLAGHWLWHGRLEGAVLELMLLGLSAIFWYGFALPFGPVVGGPQLVLLWLAWGSLR